METRTRFVWQGDSDFSWNEYSQVTIPVLPVVGSLITVKLPMTISACGRLTGDMTKVTATVAETAIDYTKHEMVVHLEDVAE